ncbi:MAG: archease [Candidatus Lokiarchaeota archaeon]|nr:archease [Candidatus Lokiarchaeota archaeon]
MKEAGFEFKDHTADVRVRSWGRTLEEAFSQTALSLMTTITPNLSKISQEIEKLIEIESEDKYALCFDFLSEFLYIFDVEELVFNKINVETIEKTNTKFKLKAVANGEKFNRNKHEIGTEVKAITYSFMEILEKKNRVEIDIVFDI